MTELLLWLITHYSGGKVYEHNKSDVDLHQQNAVCQQIQGLALGFEYANFIQAQSNSIFGQLIP